MDGEIINFENTGYSKGKYTIIALMTKDIDKALTSEKETFVYKVRVKNERLELFGSLKIEDSSGKITVFPHGVYTFEIGELKNGSAQIGDMTGLPEFNHQHIELTSHGMKVLVEDGKVVFYEDTAKK